MGIKCFQNSFTFHDRNIVNVRIPLIIQSINYKYTISENDNSTRVQSVIVAYIF